MTSIRRPPQRARASKPEGAGSSFAAFIALAKLKLSYEGVCWEDPIWDLVSAASVEPGPSRALRHERFCFGKACGWWVPLEKRQLFETGFANLTKALLVLRRTERGVGNKGQFAFLRGARVIYEVLPLPVRRDPTLLTRAHFVNAEASLHGIESDHSRYKLSLDIEEFSRAVDRHGVSRGHIDYRSSIAEPVRIDRTLSKSGERLNGLPSPNTLFALARIANEPALLEEPFDLLRMRISELLLVCGFRVGEALTLPHKPLVREPILDEAGDPRLDSATGNAMERIGLRYWPEKGADPSVKWVWTEANPLVIRAVEDIDRLCSAARRNARWLEKHPGRVNIKIEPARIYTASDLTKLLGLNNFFKWTSLERRRTSPANGRARAERATISGSELEAALATDRFDGPMLIRKNGRSQSLSESLIVVFKEISSGYHGAESGIISVPLSEGQFRAFLFGNPRQASILERRGCRDDSGAPLRVKTHAFRRLLNTVAARGGLSQLELAEWMGRSSTQHNRSYDFRTASEMAAELVPLLSANEVYGDIADRLRSLPISEQMSFAQSRLAMIHQTPYGDCTSNVAEMPCETALSCLTDCRYYARRKGDLSSRPRLMALEKETLVGLQRARDAESAGRHNAANWVRAQEAVLRNVRLALAIDDDQTIGEGDWVKINADGRGAGKPL